MSYCRWSTYVDDDNLIKWPTDPKESVEFFINGEHNKQAKKLGLERSEAYVYEHVHGGFMCHWAGNNDYSCNTAKEMAEHLTELKATGRQVPQSAIDSLNEE